MEFYTFETKKEVFSKTLYRYRSLFNGSVGSWHDYYELALQDAKKHKRFVLFLFDKTLKIENKTEEDK